MNVLDLFAGIGGFSLGLERTGGFSTVAFCEIDPKARLVLKKHWPDVPIFEDVKALNVDTLRSNGITVDVITGGFPCQDISTAGHGAGLAGERSGLWFEYHRLIKEIRPRYALIENVSALRSRGLDQVLGSLAEIGYDAEWHCIPASAVGAPHRRDRVWIVAYPANQGVDRREWQQADHAREGELRGTVPGGSIVHERPEALADTSSARLEGQRIRASSAGPEVSLFTSRSGLIRQVARSDQWTVEPHVGRVAHGVPQRVDRLKQLGNAVVPQLPELLGRAILHA